MTEHQEPLSRFSLHHGNAAKLFLSTIVARCTKSARAPDQQGGIRNKGHNAKNVTTGGKPGHVGFLKIARGAGRQA